MQKRTGSRGLEHRADVRNVQIAKWTNGVSIIALVVSFVAIIASNH